MQAGLRGARLYITLAAAPEEARVACAHEAFALALQESGQLTARAAVEARVRGAGRGRGERRAGSAHAHAHAPRELHAPVAGGAARLERQRGTAKPQLRDAAVESVRHLRDEGAVLATDSIVDTQFIK